MVIEFIEVTELEFEVRNDLWGHMEAAMASEATKKAVPANMHIDGRVIEVVWIKSEVKFDLHGFWGWLEVAMASEVAYWTQDAHGYQGN